MIGRPYAIMPRPVGCFRWLPDDPAAAWRWPQRTSASRDHGPEMRDRRPTR